MTHVRFLTDYIFTPDEDRRVAVKYRAGWAGRVRRQCAEKAKAAGAAVAWDPLDHDFDGHKGGSLKGGVKPKGEAPEAATEGASD